MPPITLDNLTKNNTGAFRAINSSTLPTTYPETFYNGASSTGFSQLAYYGDVPIGAVKAKLVTPQGSIVPNTVYVESLAVLQAYRGKGVGKQLLEWISERAKESYVHEVSLHVWKHEEKTIKWYESHGFAISEIVQGYYSSHDLEEPDAVLMVRKC